MQHSRGLLLQISRLQSLEHMTSQLCHSFRKLHLFRHSGMKKNLPPPTSQQVEVIVDGFFESTLHFVLLNYLHTLAPGIAPGIGEKRVEYPEEIGRVVMILISENRLKDIYLEIVEMECDIRESDVHSAAVTSFMDNKILKFGNCLASGDCHDCLMYIAIVCEIVLKFSSSKAKDITDRIIQKAKENLRMHAEVNECYVHVASYAKSFLNEYYSVS